MGEEGAGIKGPILMVLISCTRVLCGSVDG